MIASNGDLRAGLLGAVTAGLFSGLHDMAAGWDKVFAHGMVGGISSVAQGGKFGHGFSAGFVQSAGWKGKAFFDSLGDPATTLGRLKNAIAAAIVGGTAAVLGGGKFANGAVTGALSRLFNYELHRAEQQKLNRPLSADERAIYAEYFPSEVLDSARVYEGKVPWWLRSDMDRITLGNKIYFREGVYVAGTALGHELVHVQQYSEGMTVAKYLWASRNGYWNNPYEKQAYDKGALIRDNFCSANPQAGGC